MSTAMITRPAGPAVAAAATGAASWGVAATLTGPPRPARVLHVSRYAVYVTTGGGDPAVVAVVAADAAQVACAVRLGAPADALSLAATPADAPALVGGGRVALPHLAVQVGRWWRPRVWLPDTAPQRLAAARADLIAALRLASGGLPATALDEFRDTLATADGPGACRAADRLLGLGPGCTPSGDDVLAGLLATLHTLATAGSGAGAPRPATLATLLADHVTHRAGQRTTPLSAALLRHAAAGDASAELGAVLRQLPTGAVTSAALARLLAVGNHSGADLLTGVELALGCVLRTGAAATPRPRREVPCPS